MGADFKIIHYDKVVSVIVDMTMHEAIALADYLEKEGFEVDELRIQSATKTTQLLLSKTKSDKLMDALAFYFKHL